MKKETLKDVYLKYKCWNCRRSFTFLIEYVDVYCPECHVGMEYKGEVDLI